MPGRTKLKRTPSGKVASAKNQTCFVVMPFGLYFDSYYKDIYVPAIEGAGMTPKRADALFRPSPIINDIWEETKNAKIILADLSGRNPNVLYEVGLAHALAKPVVLITDTMEGLPFDLRYLRHIVYNKNDSKWGEILIESIKKSIEETLKSPEASVLPSFLNVDNTKKPSVTFEEKEFLYVKQKVEALEEAIWEIRSASYIAPPQGLTSLGASLLASLGAGSGATPVYSVATEQDIPSFAKLLRSHEESMLKSKESTPGTAHITIQQDAPN